MDNSFASGFDMFSLRPQTFIQKIVFFLIVAFIFEETVYGRLRLGSTSLLLAKLSSEAFLGFFLVLVILHQLVRGHFLKYVPTSFDFGIAAFLTFAVLSNWMNHGSWIQAAINVRTMLRYLTIYYIIVFVGWVPTERQIVFLVRVLVFMGLFQSFLIAVQHFAGNQFTDALFSPPETVVNVWDFARMMRGGAAKLGAGYGTFGKPVLAAFYLLFVSVLATTIALWGRWGKRRNWWLAYLATMPGIYFSYKRSAMLLVVVVPVVVAWVVGRKRFVRRCLALACLMIPVLFVFLAVVRPERYLKEKETRVSPIESLAQLLTREYWDISLSSSRGWVIREVGREALGSLRLVGYGPDEDHAKAMLSKKGGEFGKLVEWGAFDDVYFVACLVYYGPVGVGVLLLCFYSLFRRGRLLSSRFPDSRLAVLGVSLSATVILMLPSLFVVRALEFRALAFPFWALAGIVAAACKYHDSFLGDEERGERKRELAEASWSNE